MPAKSDSFSYRIFPVKGGFAYIVVGAKGLRRSGLPQKRKSDLLTLIREEFPQAKPSKDLLPDLVKALQSFFQGEKTVFKAKLDLSDLPPFTASVYRSLRKIPWGKTVTYKGLATLIGSPKAARGVGAAMGRNPFPPVVPCHRVLGTNGALTGFSAVGGLELKRSMLIAEGLIPSSRQP